MRVYHFHIRKTAGTSLNAAFWELGGLGLDDVASNAEAVGNGRRFVLHDPALIAAGDYFFASSHEPMYDLELPADTFTVTILRDPVRRLLSYCRYLVWSRGAVGGDPFLPRVRREARVLDGGPRNAVARYSPRHLREDRELLGGGYRDAVGRRLRSEGLRPELRRLIGRGSPNHVFSQLHMFSARLDPVEAAENALACDAVLFTESYERDLAALSRRLGIELSLRRERSFGDSIVVTERERAILEERLRPEYEMIELVREQLGR